MRARIDADLERTIATMKALKARGVRVLPGGDYGFMWNPHGANARDLQYFVDLLGFTPMEAIVGATKWGGEIMGRPDELGQVREGYLADLLLVDGDPLADLRLLEDRARLLAVMKDGVFHQSSGVQPGNPLRTTWTTASPASRRSCARQARALARAVRWRSRTKASTSSSTRAAPMR